MTVTVRFFASLREVMDVEALCLDLNAGTLASLRDQLRCVLTAVQWEAVTQEGVQVAVNQAIVQGEIRLREGDEVAFLPPVTGG